MVQRRPLVAGGLVSLLGAPWVAGSAAASTAPAAASPSAPSARVLRTAFSFAETGFDPPQVSDTSSSTTLAHIIEPPLTYDALARPPRLVPLTAAALPEVSADFRHFVLTLRPGIFFADDPAFNGQRRELVAADVVYSIKRFFDPALVTEHLYSWENLKLLGLNELRQRVLKAGKGASFPYDTEVPGLRALDRYRLELRLADPAPRLPHLLASVTLAGTVAREVVERYGADIMAHPVGTGPYRLAQWRRSSRIVLERNPGYREERFTAQPAPDDAEGQALLRQLQGQLVPRLERIEVQIINESQPRWLAFLGGELHTVELPPEFAPLAVPGGRTAPHLARRGVVTQRALDASTAMSFFNTEDPLVGGHAPAQVALRRAIALALDTAEELRLVYKGEGQPALTLVPPACYGFDDSLRHGLGRADTAAANALLDLHGYRRGAGGWRTRPDGQPMVLLRGFSPNQRSRAQAELWTKRLRAVGLRIEYLFAPFGELIKQSLAGKLMMWGFIWTAPDPDGDFYLGLAYGPNAAQSNDARFRLPAFDRLYEQQRVLPDGPERLALMRECQRLMIAHQPYIAHHHPYRTDLLAPGLNGLRRHPFRRDLWRYAGFA